MTHCINWLASSPTRIFLAIAACVLFAAMIDGVPGL